MPRPLPSPAPVTLPHTEVIDVRSEHADADYQLWIATPVEGMVPLPDGPRPVLYVLDANLFFGTAVEMTRLMSRLYGEIPPVIVVGIAYDTSSPVLQAELRARDFTPAVDPGFAAMTSSIPGAPEPTLPEGRRLGRAERFLDFLTEEVVPTVARRHDVAARSSVLFGSSLGGLFSLYAMLRRPAAFDAHIAVSPALWWDDGAMLREATTWEIPPPQAPGRLFLAVGGLEERPEIPSLARFRMVSNVLTLADALQKRPSSGVQVEVLVVEGETHTSIVPVGLTRGLRSLLCPTRVAGGASAYRSPATTSGAGRSPAR